MISGGSGFIVIDASLEFRFQSLLSGVATLSTLDSTSPSVENNTLTTLTDWLV